VCDGRSMTGFCRDLIHEYEWLQRGAPGDPNGVVGAVSPPLEEVLPPGLMGPGLREVIGDYVARMTELEKSPPGFVLKAGDDSGKPPARHVLTYQLPPSQVDALTSLARANGATVGGAISAAILRAGVGLGGPDAEEECGFITNIDLRPHLREQVPISNMGMYASSSIDVLAGIRTKPFWEVARTLTDKVRSSIESLQAFCGILLAKQMFEILRDSGLRTYWPQLMVANLGHLDLPAAADSFRVRSIHGGTPMLGHGPFMFCSAVGLSGTIMIDVNYQSPDVPDDVAHSFGTSLLDRLTVESGTPSANSDPAPAAQ
jgi:phthiocerol/phthiodiolone dimycocerosyl transferase-like enzyme